MNELIEKLEKMTDAEVEALMNEELPEELEKDAAAELAGEELTDALYTYGWLSAERAMAEVDGVEKVAEEQVQAEEEVGQIIEKNLGELGTAANEDEIALHKEAQAAAAIIFEGYTDCIEKTAGLVDAAGKPLKDSGKVKRFLAEMASKSKAHGNKARELAGKHRGYLAGGAGGAAGAVIGYKAKKHMDKKASEMTVGEIVDTINAAGELGLGVEKLANAAAEKGVSLMSRMKSSGGKTWGAVKKHVVAHKGKYSAGAGALVGAGAGTAVASKKD